MLITKNFNLKKMCFKMIIITPHVYFFDYTDQKRYSRDKRFHYSKLPKPFPSQCLLHNIYEQMFIKI